MNPRIKTLCELDIPYPEVRVERKNPNYARLLSLAYAGPDSELTTILLYVYGHHTARGKNPDALCDTLKYISMIEMRHLDMLGELILLLGGDPRFCGPNGRMGINTAMLGYSADPCKIMRNAIAGEENAVRLYRDLIRAIDDRCVRDVLRRIVMDEEHHIKIFKEMCAGK